MVREAAIDAVVIAAPTTAHPALAHAAIERGLPVLVEKPLAATNAEALRIVDAGRAGGVPVQVGHVERYNPAVLELGRLLREGWLTTIYAIVSRRAGPFPARIRDVGVTVDLATHDVDMLSWIAGERPTRVYAELAQRKHATHEDLLFGLLHFPSGATGMLDVNWLTPAKRRQLTVVGEEGMFELDYLTQRLTFTKSDLAHGELIAGYAPTFTGDVLEIAVETHEPLEAQLDAFVRAIRTGERPYVDGEDGAWAVRIATSLLEAGVERPPRQPRRRRGAPHEPDRHAPVRRRLDARRLDHRAVQPVHARAGPRRPPVDRRGGDRRHRGGRRRRQDGPAARRAVRHARLVRHRGGRQPRGRRGDQRRPLARRRGAGPGRAGQPGPCRGPAARHPRCGGGGARGRRGRAHRPRDARRRAAAGLPVHGRGRRRRSRPASTPAAR